MGLASDLGNAMRLIIAVENAYPFKCRWVVPCDRVAATSPLAAVKRERCQYCKLNDRIREYYPDAEPPNA